MKRRIPLLSLLSLVPVLVWPAEAPSTIQPDDTVTIFALNADEISRAWRVNSAGELNLPMVGRIDVNDLPVTELEKEITERLRRSLLSG